MPIYTYEHFSDLYKQNDIMEVYIKIIKVLYQMWKTEATSDYLNCL
jgi:hypothetical protein